MTILIDSTVLIDLERRGLKPGFLEEILAEPCAMAAITLSELLFGLHRAVTTTQRLRREGFVNDAIEEFAVIPFDLSVARVHSRIWAELVASGQTIGTHDYQIAATALAHEYTLLTDNVREFSRVPGLQVRQPDW